MVATVALATAGISPSLAHTVPKPKKPRPCIFHVGLSDAEKICLERYLHRVGKYGRALTAWRQHRAEDTRQAEFRRLIEARRQLEHRQASSSGIDWYAIAQCESGGDWSSNTGNGYYGGLQFTSSTWLSAGGGSYAARADLASASAQIATANRWVSMVGCYWCSAGWPVCGRFG
jgi:Transglycosylase-like domain